MPVIWVLVASLAGLALMAYDKNAAIAGRWRIPERVLLLVGLLGGTPGLICGMLLLRHKIRKLAWVLGLPLLLIAQVWVAWHFRRPR